MLNKFIATGIAALSMVVSLSAYPLGLDVVGPVQASGSDAQAQAYNAFAPTINSYIGNVNGVFNPQNSATTQVISDPTNVLSNSDATVRIYWVNNSAAYNNTIGFSPTATISPSTASVVFPNASVKASSPNPGDANSPYSGLVAGNFVDLGLQTQGTPFQLFLAADAADGPNKGIFYANAALNADGINHLKMVQFLGTNYYLIGWEDLPLSVSDLDYNDVFIVAEIIAVPEPMTYVIFAMLAGVILFIQRRKTVKVTDK